MQNFAHGTNHEEMGMDFDDAGMDLGGGGFSDDDDDQVCGVVSSACIVLYLVYKIFM